MTAPRLSDRTIGQARAGVRLPRHDRAALRPRIVHLGLGAFARAHLAHYTGDALDGEGGDWGILGVSLRHPEQRDRLAPQDGLYATLERDAAGERARIVGCVLGVLVAPEDPEAVLARLADPATSIVTLTITERGYGHDPATGRLDPGHPNIAHDLAHPAAPRGAVGLLVKALRRRRDAGLAPPTVLSCDNLPANGRLLAGLVRDLAAMGDDALAGWIEREVAFPSCMVDRIVPAATPADAKAALRATGLVDAAPVVHEPFRQWVIEDRFAGGRPAWDAAGAQLVADVAPYEDMKLRLLNGAHSALAYLGLLAGHVTIGEAAGDPALRVHLGRLWDEVRPTLHVPPGEDLARYTGALLARFDNPAIRHLTAQVARDGSQKLPQRLLAPACERLRAGQPIPCLALTVAAWIRHLGGTDDSGRPIAPHDPLAGTLRARLAAGGPGAVLAEAAVFSPDLAGDPRFAAAVTGAYESLREHGARGAAQRA